MGSFICRLYVSRYHDDGISGAIFMGTGGPNPATGVGRALASMIGALCGKKHKSKLLHGVIFSTYNKGFEGRTAFDWLSRDPVIADNYISNPDHGFLFTAQGVHDLIDANVACNSDEWYKDVPVDLPILLVSGEKDPVGDRSKGVEFVYDRLKATGHENVTKKIYRDCRHEVLNELNKDEVMADILDWMRK
jgi:alpha-beta hydrolase superfamily lysophospholipase